MTDAIVLKDPTESFMGRLDVDVSVLNLWGEPALELETEHTGDDGGGVTDSITLSQGQARELQQYIKDWLGDD